MRNLQTNPSKLAQRSCKRPPKLTRLFLALVLGQQFEHWLCQPISLYSHLFAGDEWEWSADVQKRPIPLTNSRVHPKAPSLNKLIFVGSFMYFLAHCTFFHDIWHTWDSFYWVRSFSYLTKNFVTGGYEHTFLFCNIKYLSSFFADCHPLIDKFSAGFDHLILNGPASDFFLGKGSILNYYRSVVAVLLLLLR